MDEQEEYSFQTAQIHASLQADPNTRAIAPSISTSTAYSLETQEYIEDLISGKAQGHFYSRMTNPTNQIFEQRMAVLEGGFASISCATGQAATMVAALSLGKAGDNFVVSSFLFGGTFHQWKAFLPRLGITSKFVDSYDAKDFEAAIDENTKGIFLESIANPSLRVLDIEAICEAAHRHGVPVIVDNTAGAGGYLLKPIALGADVVIHSATKWIAGHGSTMGGVAISSGKFPFKDNARFPEFNQELPGFPGLILADKGPSAHVVKMRSQTLRDLGATLSPFSSFLLLQGLETLSLRVDKQCFNAFELAKYLRTRPEVTRVIFPGLETHETHAVAVRLLKNGFGGLLGFSLKAVGDKTSKQVAELFLSKVKLAYVAANLGDVRTLVLMPTSTTHRQLDAAEQERNGTPSDLVRVSLGVESIKDIIADFDQAINAVQVV